MQNYKMILQYEGTRYQGWQRQDSTENTIQGKMETLLTKMCGHKVEVQGSGRTDAGVHAKGQVMNAHIDTKMSTDEILAYINQYLPDDIGVVSVKKVSERFHSRLLAKEKTYCYRVINSSLPHVFDRRYAYSFPEKLNMESMKKAAEKLQGTHDFAAFTSLKRTKKSTVRTIREIRIEKEGDIISFTFTGDGFLYHMIRIIMGTLLEVGTDKRNPDDIEQILSSKEREKAGMLVPAMGLTLLTVKYD